MRKSKADTIRDFLDAKPKLPLPVARMLRAELRNSKKRAEKKKSRKETRRGKKMLARWATYVWFKNHGCTRDDALLLAAQALGKRTGGKSTIEHGYKATRRWFTLPPGSRALPPLRGLENMEFTDFAGVPDENALTNVLKKHIESKAAHWFETHGCTHDEAQKLTAQVLQALGESFVCMPDKNVLTNVLKQHIESIAAARPS